MASFKRTRVGDHDAYSIAYRVRQFHESCIFDVAEIIVVASSLPGNAQGFRARYWLCDWEVKQFGKLRSRILDSFRVVTGPPAYYTQFVFAHGITVKASASVAPEALVKAAESVSRMIVGLRHDIRVCLVREGAAMAIYPEDGFVVELPEFARHKGEKVPYFDILYDDFQGGLGAVKGQPVSATTESDLLRDHDTITGYITMHEFAHAVMNLCFSREDHAEVVGLYKDALQANAFPGSYAMTNVDEFFAETSIAYFNIPHHDWGFAGTQPIQDALRTTLPKTFAFLEGVYGEPPLPPPIPTPGPFRQIVNRDHKYAYSIEIPEVWWRRANDEYWGGLSQVLAIRSVNLANGTTLEQFAQSVRDEPLGGWSTGPGSTESEPFEITSFERTQVGDLDAYSIAYRILEISHDHPFFYDVVEIVVVASSLPGNPQGFRARCMFHPWRGDYSHGAVRTQICDSFRVFAE